MASHRELVRNTGVPMVADLCDAIHLLVTGRPRSIQREACTSCGCAGASRKAVALYTRSCHALLALRSFECEQTRKLPEVEAAQNGDYLRGVEALIDLYIIMVPRYRVDLACILRLKSNKI